MRAFDRLSVVGRNQPDYITNLVCYHCKKFISVLREFGFKGGYPDPCLMTRQSKEELIFTAIWVDDTLLVGNKKAINKTIEELRKKVDKFERKYGDMFKALQNYCTPGTPGQHIPRNVDVKVDSEKHSIYRSGIGMLLYRVKHLRPDIANAVRGDRWSTTSGIYRVFTYYQTHN